MKYQKEIKGFLLAPIFPSLVFSLIATGMGLYSGLKKEEIETSTYLFGGLIWFISALPVSYVVTFAFGIPGYIVYVKKGINSLKAYLLGGSVLGLLAPIVLLIIIEFKTIIEMGFWLLFASVVSGIITSYMFWLIAVKSPNNAFNTVANKDSRPLT